MTSSTCLHYVINIGTNGNNLKSFVCVRNRPRKHPNTNRSRKIHNFFFQQIKRDEKKVSLLYNIMAVMKQIPIKFKRPKIPKQAQTQSDFQLPASFHRQSKQWAKPPRVIKSGASVRMRKFRPGTIALRKYENLKNLQTS